MSERLKAAAQLIEDNETVDAAFRMCLDELQENPDSAPANTLAGVIQCRAGHYGTALGFFARAAECEPKRAEMWNNLGTVWHELRQPARARQHFMRALEIRPDALYMVNIGVTFSDEANHEEALKWLHKAEKVKPDLPSLKNALAFANLALGNWAQGWKDYESNLGGRFRKKLDFGGKDWDGSAVGTLVIYGEQGIGDEVMFGSCIPDAMRLAKRTIIECDPRLESLYKRSFPEATVHGTRRLDRPWLADVNVDAQVACGSLPSLFRRSPADCPRAPYLVADPERRLMWKTLFGSWGKKVVGLTWSGGKFASQLTKRTMGLESLRPLIEAHPDWVFVSLQYNDPREEIAATGLPVKFFEETLKERDLDGLAAMVAELDDIVGIHTTVHHLAGALGKASRIFVPYQPLWLYAHGDRLPWYQSQTYIRQKKDERWVDTVRRSL